MARPCARPTRYESSSAPIRRPIALLLGMCLNGTPVRSVAHWGLLVLHIATSAVLMMVMVMAAHVVVVSESRSLLHVHIIAHLISIAISLICGVVRRSSRRYCAVTCCAVASYCLTMLPVKHLLNLLRTLKNPALDKSANFLNSLTSSVNWQIGRAHV